MSDRFPSPEAPNLPSQELLNCVQGHILELHGSGGLTEMANVATTQCNLDLNLLAKEIVGATILDQIFFESIPVSNYSNQEKALIIVRTIEQAAQTYNPYEFIIQGRSNANLEIDCRSLYDLCRSISDETLRSVVHPLIESCKEEKDKLGSLQSIINFLKSSATIIELLDGHGIESTNYAKLIGNFEHSWEKDIALPISEIHAKARISMAVLRWRCMNSASPLDCRRLGSYDNGNRLYSATGYLPSIVANARLAGYSEGDMAILESANYRTLIDVKKNFVKAFVQKCKGIPRIEELGSLGDFKKWFEIFLSNLNLTNPKFYGQGQIISNQLLVELKTYAEEVQNTLGVSLAKTLDQYIKYENILWALLPTSGITNKDREKYNFEWVIKGLNQLITEHASPDNQNPLDLKYNALDNYTSYIEEILDCYQDFDSSPRFIIRESRIPIQSLQAIILHLKIELSRDPGPPIDNLLVRLDKIAKILENIITKIPQAN